MIAIGLENRKHNNSLTSMKADKIFQLLLLHYISVYDVSILCKHLKAEYDNTRHEEAPPWCPTPLGAFSERGRDGTPLLPLLTHI